MIKKIVTKIREASENREIDREAKTRLEQEQFVEKELAREAKIDARMEKLRQRHETAEAAQNDQGQDQSGGQEG